MINIVGIPFVIQSVGESVWNKLPHGYAMRKGIKMVHGEPGRHLETDECHDNAIGKQIGWFGVKVIR